jgi:hypothetical protein
VGTSVGSLWELFSVDKRKKVCKKRVLKMQKHLKINDLKVLFCARDWIGLRTSRDSHKGRYKNLIAPSALRFFAFIRFSKQAWNAHKCKNPSASLRGFCARDWIRTSTWFPTLRPEHSASTNFATRAGGKCRRIQGKEKMIPRRWMRISAGTWIYL